MTTTATEHPTLTERAVKAFDEHVARSEAESAQRAQSDRERSERDVREALTRLLGIDALDYIEVVGESNVPIVAHVDGLAFRYWNPAWGDRYTHELQVAQTCVRCGNAVWVQTYSIEHLGSVLQSEHQHDYGCLAQYDEDGEPITDADGKPLPPKAQRPRRLSPEEKAREAIAAIAVAANECAIAHDHVAALANRRPLVKAGAIGRLMQATNANTGKLHSATSAEAVVELDDEFTRHREIEREAEVDRWRSLAAYEAAKLTAKLEVALAEAATRGGEC